MLILVFYGIYILFSVAFTYWVGQNLFRNGRIFLIDSFHSDERKADSVNQLLLVGFYLVNFGLISLFLSVGQKPADTVQAFELLAQKIGVVLIVLGGMHFFNMKNIAKMRSKALHPNGGATHDAIDPLVDENGNLMVGRSATSDPR